MAKLVRFEEMDVWILARNFNQRIYAASGNGAFHKDYGLVNQIRRAAVSIVSNIAEGFESRSNPSFVRFLATARGSAAEVRAQLYLALDLGYIPQDQFDALKYDAECISRQLTGLITYLSCNAKTPKP